MQLSHLCYNHARFIYPLRKVWLQVYDVYCEDVCNKHIESSNWATAYYGQCFTYIASFATYYTFTKSHPYNNMAAHIYYFTLGYA